MLAGERVVNVVKRAVAGARIALFVHCAATAELGSVISPLRVRSGRIVAGVVLRLIVPAALLIALTRLIAGIAVVVHAPCALLDA